MITLQQARRTWRTIPVDDRGYLHPRELLELSDRALIDWINQADEARYGLNGWRNHQGGWVRGMHQGLHGRRILDFGCGTGLEARSLARAGNTLLVADINPASVELAQRVLALDGHDAPGRPVRGRAPFVTDIDFDVFLASGVLHHIPWAPEVLAWAAKQLPDHGEMRLLLYTDRARDRAEQLECPLGESLDFEGVYADWYDERKLASILPAGWTVARWEYITPEGWYATARVVRA